jgi:hypothetical protein
LCIVLRAKRTFLVGIDVVVRAALLQAVAVECDHTHPATPHVAYHLLGVFVVGAVGVAGVVTRVEPHIAWTTTHAVVVEVDVAGETGEAGVVATAVLAGRFTGITSEALVGVSLGRAAGHAGVLVKIGTDTVETVAAIDTTSTVLRTLPAVTVRTTHFIIKDGTRGKAQAIELHVTTRTHKTVFG